DYGELFSQPSVQKRKGAHTIDLVRPLESRELGAIPGAQPAINLPHALELFARKINVDRVVFRARLDHQRPGSDHPRQLRVAEAREQIRQVVFRTMNASDEGRGSRF